MGLAKRLSAYTVDQYLEIERASEDRHFYVDGDIFAMAGESGAHGDISVNLVALLANQLKNTPCRARTKDTKVRSGPTPLLGKSTRGMFSYPDVVVICDELEYHDAHKDVILNPRVIVEVLSESTEAFDRGENFTRLRMWNSSLTDYLLVLQDKAQVEHYTRTADGSWSLNTYTGLDASVSIPSIQCTLKLADVYDRVAFPKE